MAVYTCGVFIEWCRSETSWKDSESSEVGRGLHGRHGRPASKSRENGEKEKNTKSRCLLEKFEQTKPRGNPGLVTRTDMGAEVINTLAQLTISDKLVRE